MGWGWRDVYKLLTSVSITEKLNPYYVTERTKGYVYCKSMPVFPALCYTVLTNFTMKYQTRLERWLIS